MLYYNQPTLILSSAHVDCRDDDTSEIESISVEYLTIMLRLGRFFEDIVSTNRLNGKLEEEDETNPCVPYKTESSDLDDGSQLTYVCSMST